MKKTILTAAIALTGLAAFSTTQAQQFTQTNAVLGDLMLGFENTGGGGSTNLVVDLGSVTNFIAHNAFDFNLNSDLVSVFGSNYSSTVSYALYAVTANKTIYASAPVTNTSGYPVESASSQGSQKIAFGNLLTTFNNDGNPTAPNQTTTYGVYEGVSELYSWGSFTPANQAFGSADYPSIDIPIGQSATLFVQAPSTGGGNGVATSVQNFSVSATGQVVPEPSTYALIALGALFLVVGYRRRLQS